MYNRDWSFIRWLFLTMAALVLSACGGGGSGDSLLSLSGQSSYKLSAQVSSSSIGLNGSSAVNVTVTDAGGNAVANQVVMFSVSGSGSVSPSSATTDASGKASTTLTAGGTVGNGNVQVKLVDPNSNVASTAAPFTVSDGYTVTLTSSKTSVKSGNGDSAIITAQVTDSAGGAVANQAVNFSIGTVTNGSFSGASTVQTDNTGRATITFLPSTQDRSNKTVTITGKAVHGNATVTSTITVNVTGTTIQLNAPQTNLTANSSVLVTATLNDGNGLAISNQTLAFSSAGLPNGSASVVTNSSGQAQVTLTAPSSVPGGQLAISAAGAGANSSLSFSVSTTSFQLTATNYNTGVVLTQLNTQAVCTKTASAATPSQPSAYPSQCVAPLSPAPSATTTAKVVAHFDNGGTPAANQTVYFNSTLGMFFTPDNAASPSYYTPSAAASAVTDTNGNATVILGSQFAGQAIIHANTAVDPNTGKPAQQASTTLQFVATTPTQISVQAAQTTLAPGAQTQIVATIRDAINNPVQGMVIQFARQADDSNGYLSAATGTTDANGNATVTYTAGANSGASNGVQIQASIQSFPGVTLPNNVAKITVGGQAVSVAIATGNTVLILADNVTYSLPHTVVVTNTSGQPVANQPVSLAVIPVSYFKGNYASDGTNWFPTSSLTQLGTGYVPVDSTKVYSPDECPNEDLNLNGILDATENNGAGSGVDVFGPDSYPGTGDVIDNGDGKLWPGSPVTLSAATVTTDSNGIAAFNVLYGKSFGNWVKVKIVATTLVQGSESTSNRVFSLPIAAADGKVNNGSPPGGLSSPFGRSTNCANPL